MLILRRNSYFIYKYIPETSICTINITTTSFIIDHNFQKINFILSTKKEESRQ